MNAPCSLPTFSAHSQSGREVKRFGQLSSRSFELAVCGDAKNSQLHAVTAVILLCGKLHEAVLKEDESELQGGEATRPVNQNHSGPGTAETKQVPGQSRKCAEGSPR